MRQRSRVLPLVLVIALLCGVLFMMRPDGLLAPYLPIYESDEPTPNEPDSNDPKDDPSKDPSNDPPSEPDVPSEPSTLPELPHERPTTPTVPSVPSEPEVPIEPEQPTVPSEPDEPTKPLPTYDYPMDISAYLPAISYHYDSILLVNKTHPLGPAFSPGIVNKLPSTLTLYRKDVQLEITAASAVEAMLLCMRADGITNTYVTSGYRSYQYQVMLQNTYVREEKSRNPSLSQAEALAIVRTYSAAPGSSEHQSGLCVDLMTTSMSDLDESFENTAAFTWLQENAAHFGFILRYPKGKEHITGYTYEPWHYRFVGRDAAIEITEAGLTLEEYLNQ